MGANESKPESEAADSAPEMAITKQTEPQQSALSLNGKKSVNTKNDQERPSYDNDETEYQQQPNNKMSSKEQVQLSPEQTHPSLDQQQDDTDSYADVDAAVRSPYPKQQPGLSTEVWTLRIPTNHQAQRHALETHGEDSWEHYVLDFLHQNAVQYTLAALLFLDILILLTELALLTFYPDCSIIRRDGYSCCPASTTTRSVAAAAGDYHGFCPNDQVTMDQIVYEVGCDEHKWHRVHSTEKVMFGATLAILSIFLLELTVTMWALKPWVFFRQVFYAFDWVIVTTSMALEITFHVLRDEDSLEALVGLIALGRMWRFVRIGHGIMELVSEWNEDHYKTLLAYTNELEERLVQNGIDLPLSQRSVLVSIRQRDQLE